MLSNLQPYTSFKLTALVLGFPVRSFCLKSDRAWTSVGTSYTCLQLGSSSALAFKHPVIKHNSGIIGQFCGNNARRRLQVWAAACLAWYPARRGRGYSMLGSNRWRDSEPRTSSSTVDSSRSEPEDFQEPGQELDVGVVSLLSILSGLEKERLKHWTYTCTFVAFPVFFPLGV